MEKEIKIVFVPKEQLPYDDSAMIRISCDGYKDGWGSTFEKAIRDFDKENKLV